MVKVGFCVAYDWYLLKHSLPLIYPFADKVCLSIDRDRISWSGNKFVVDEIAFAELVKKIDTQNKIHVLQDDFHISSLTPMQNEVRQRNMMAECMGEGGWHIQLDCDEYFVGFDDFVSYLKSLSFKDKRYNVCCLWVTLFKEVEGGFLYILPSSYREVEEIQIATQSPKYEYGRRNGNFNIHTNFLIIHQSWARRDEEISQKISNWGHANDFDAHAFQMLWKDLDRSNYGHLENFHPIAPKVWGRLKFFPATGIEDLMNSFKATDFASLNAAQLMIRNSKFASKIKAALNRLRN